MEKVNETTENVYPFFKCTKLSFGKLSQVMNQCYHCHKDLAQVLCNNHIRKAEIVQELLVWKKYRNDITNSTVFHRQFNTFRTRLTSDIKIMSELHPFTNFQVTNAIKESYSLWIYLKYYLKGMTGISDTEISALLFSTSDTMHASIIHGSFFPHLWQPS